MSDTNTIKSAFERNARAMSLRPQLGLGTARTSIRIVDGLTCEVQEGEWKLVADMPQKQGGTNLGPNPGVFGRAALGTCISMCCIRWAAYLDVPIEELTVEIEADYDARGEYGIEGIRSGYSEVRYLIHVRSQADEADIMNVLDKVHAHTPFIDVFSSPQSVVREIRIVNPKAEAAS